MSIGPDIGGDIADAPTHGDIIFNLDVILDWLEVHVGEIVEGDLPFDERIDAVLTNQEVRDVVAKRVAEAQAQGRAFPFPTARELADARQRALARQQQD